MAEGKLNETGLNQRMGDLVVAEGSANALQALLLNAAAQIGTAQERRIAQRLLKAADGREVTLRAERRLKFEATRSERARTRLRKIRGFKDAAYSRPDWLFVTDATVLVVEIKIQENKHDDVEPDQLRRYRIAMRRNPETGTRRHHGMVVLARGQLSEFALGGEETRDVRMACLLWKDLAGQLDELVPLDSPRRMAWVNYLTQASGITIT